MKGYISISSIQPVDTKAFDLVESTKSILEKKASFASMIDALIEIRESGQTNTVNHCLLEQQGRILSVDFSENPPFKDIYRNEGKSSLFMYFKADYNDTLRQNAGEHLADCVIKIMEKVDPRKLVENIHFNNGHPYAEVFCYTDSVNTRMNYINLQKALNKGVIFMGNGSMVILDDLNRGQSYIVNDAGEIIEYTPTPTEGFNALNDDTRKLVSDLAFDQGVMMARDALALWNESAIVRSWRVTEDQGENDDNQFVVDIDIENIICGEASQERISMALNDLNSIMSEDASVIPDMENITDTLEALNYALHEIVRTEGMIFVEGSSRFIHELEVFHHAMPFAERVKHDLEAQDQLAMG